MMEKLAVQQFKGTTRNRRASYGKYYVTLQFQIHKSRKYDDWWCRRWCWGIQYVNKKGAYVAQGYSVSSKRALERINTELRWKHS